MNTQKLSLWFYLSNFVAGASLVFAFAPLGYYPIAWVAPALLFYSLLQAKDKKQHFLLAWCYGIGMFITGASWIFYSMHFYAHASIPVAATFTLIFVLIIALSIGLFGLLTALFHHHTKLSRLLFFYPFSWVLIEWFRGWFLTGFPWLYLGNSQIETSLVNIAPITGVLGVSLLVVLLSGALSSLFILNKSQKMLWRDQSSPHHVTIEDNSGRKVQFIIGISVLLLFIGTHFIEQIQWTQPTKKTLTVSLIQGNIPQEKKWLPENKQPTLDLYQKLTQEHWDSDLIIWPETAIPDVLRHHMDDFILPLQQQAQQHQTDLLFGAFYQNEQGKLENSVLALTRQGRDIYSKQHLVPFSEYIPLLGYLGWLNRWMQLPSDNLSAGTTKNTLQLTDNIAQLSICYEDAFSREILKGLPQAHFLINISNDGWFTGSIEPYQHMEIAQMRAIETGRYLLRATNTGVSGIVNTKGKLIATATPYQTEVITHNIQPHTGKTPFMRWGDWGIVLSSLLLLLLGYFIIKKQQPE
ncbi:MAG: apolipoprotein N-acyltransferase [Cocleimonas sp.]|nr:apolipoprotein N-acyltransferase [Cocleimonas sp.]